MSHAKTAVSPVGGADSGFLSVARSLPRELLPLLDKPVRQYGAEDACVAGTETLVFVTAPGKAVLDGYIHSQAWPKGHLAATRQLELIDAHKERGSNVLAIVDVERDTIGAHGYPDVSTRNGQCPAAPSLTEKPNTNMAPCTQAVIGRYILQSPVLSKLSNYAPGAGGEIQLSEAITADAGDHGHCGFEIDGFGMIMAANPAMVRHWSQWRRN